MTDLLEWVDAAGIITPLTDQQTLDVEWGITGRFMPPIEHVEDDVPQQDGSRLRLVRVRPRDVPLKLSVLGDDEQHLRTLLRQLVALFSPSRGDGRLRATRADGTARELRCRYKGGLDALSEDFESSYGWQRAVLVLRAHDPYWYDTVARSITYRPGAPQPFFPDLAINSDRIIGTQTVVNDGDVDAWPVWTVHGAASRFHTNNDTTGRSLQLSTALTAAQSAVADTRPFVKTVRRDDGTNLFAVASQPPSSLWPLIPGDNQVSIVLPDTSPESYVTLDFFRRWWTP